MHIVFVCSEYPYCSAKPTGGFGTYVKQLTEALIDAGHYITVIALKDWKYSKVQQGRNLHVLTLSNFIPVQFEQFPLIGRIVRFVNYPILFGFNVFRAIKKLEHVDVIEGGDFGAELFFYLLFKTKRSPRIFLKLHTPSFVIQKFNEEKKTIFYRIMDVLESFCLKKADVVYSPTHALAHIIEHEKNIVSRAIIPYPHKALQSKNTVRSKIILFIGKLQRKKGVFILANAIPHIHTLFPQYRFVFIGPDTYHGKISTKDKLKEIFKKNSVLKSITFLGNISQRTVFDYYKKAAITVVPSLWDNFPNVILESMTYGSVVIASDSGGIPEIIDDNKTGLLFEVGNNSELAAKTCSLLDNKKLLKDIRSHAYQEIASKFDPKIIVKKTILLYTSIS